MCVMNSLAFIPRTTVGLFRCVNSPRVICPLAGATQLRAMRDAKGRAVRKENLPSKPCLNCGRDFTWRKKWENCWDEVTCCSKRCRSEMRSARKAANRVDGDDESDTENESLRRRRGESVEAKRARKKKSRERKGDADAAMKPCDACARKRDVLVRCRSSNASEWRMLCGKCWRDVSGGVVDGTPDNEGYAYGGMWKNMRREGATARMPASAKAHASAVIAAE